MEPMNQVPQQNPYDFITNPGQPGKKPGLGGSPAKTRLIIVIAGAVLLIVIISIVAMILSNAGKRDIPGLKSIAAEQQELIRIAELGKDRTTDATTRTLAYNTSLSTTTQQQKLIAYLDTRGTKMDKIQLGIKKDASLEAELESAAANNRFDEEFGKVLNASLLEYNDSLSKAYKSAAGPKSKAILEESFNNSVTILGLK
ncbi:MAG: hypothetical protein WAQ57_04520 [Candidatus Saccharimonadales bacterium]